MTKPLTPGENFGEALIAAMLDACTQGKLVQIQLAIDPSTFQPENAVKKHIPGAMGYTHLLRIMIMQDKGPQPLGKHQIIAKMNDIEPQHGKDSGFYYTHGNVRVTVTPEDMTINFPLHAPLGTPDHTKDN